MPTVVLPINTSTKTISATSTSSSTALFTTGKANALLVQNAGTNTVFIRVGTGTQTAVLTDLPILNGNSRIIKIEPAGLEIGCICAATETATVHATSVYIELSA